MINIEFHQINTDTPEGRLLIAAMSMLCINVDQTPIVMMKKITDRANEIYKDSPLPKPPQKTLGGELTELLNRYSKENGSNTPDFILSDFLLNCLNTFEVAVNARSSWYTVQKAEEKK